MGFVLSMPMFSLGGILWLAVSENREDLYRARDCCAVTPTGIILLAISFRVKKR
jgi:hypothetical protein